MNPIFDLEWPVEKILKTGEYKTIKCHNIHGDSGFGMYEINLPYFVEGSPEDWLFWKDKLFKVLESESISMGP